MENEELLRGMFGEKLEIPVTERGKPYYQKLEFTTKIDSVGLGFIKNNDYYYE